MLATGGVVKVLDFGVGLILDDVDGGRLTSSDVTVGTARYMAPEQARQRAVTAAADLYALGCVLYEMLDRRAAVRWRHHLRGAEAARRAGADAGPARCAARSQRSWTRSSPGCWRRTRRTGPPPRPRSPSCCCRSRWPPASRERGHPAVPSRSRRRATRAARAAPTPAGSGGSGRPAAARDEPVPAARARRSSTSSPSTGG